MGRKGVKRLLLVGHEKVPRGFGLRTGDLGGDIADGAGNRGKPASCSWITGRNWEPSPAVGFYFFPEKRYP